MSHFDLRNLQKAPALESVLTFDVQGPSLKSDLLIHHPSW